MADFILLQEMFLILKLLHEQEITLNIDFNHSIQYTFLFRHFYKGTINILRKLETSFTIGCVVYNLHYNWWIEDWRINLLNKVPWNFDNSMHTRTNYIYILHIQHAVFSGSGMLKSFIIYQQQWSFLLRCKNLCHFKYRRINKSIWLPWLWDISRN